MVSRLKRSTIRTRTGCTDRCIKIITCVHPHVLLQGVVVIAGLFANCAHEVGDLCVCGHMSPQGRLAAEGLLAGFAHKCSFPGVDDQVGLEVILVGEELFTEVTLVDGVTTGGAPDPTYDWIGSGEKLVLCQGRRPSVNRGAV